MSVARLESRPTRMLVISSGSGSMTPELESKLRKSFSDYTVVEFDPKEDLTKVASAQARIVVAGGDGSVEFMVRKFADSQHPIGIIPLGTFNNLAKALGLPTDVNRAIEVARDGRARPITLGRVNDHIFVEACAVGLFGETIALGDAAKGGAYGQVSNQVKNVIAAKRFSYELDGDIQGSGSAMSLVFSNTGSIGSQLAISDTSPTNPYLEFSVHAGRTRFDIVRRTLAAVVRRGEAHRGVEQVFKFNKLQVTTKPRVSIYADNFRIGRTPATVTAETSALKVMLPE